MKYNIELWKLDKPYIISNRTYSLRGISSLYGYNVNLSIIYDALSGCKYIYGQQGYTGIKYYFWSIHIYNI